MKANWLLAALGVCLASCEEPAPISAGPATERKRPAPTKIEDVPASPAPAPQEAAAAAETPPPAPEDPAPAPPPPPAVKPVGIPEATLVEGKPGFVFSPFNGKIVDVRNIPPGTLVADPTYPVSENKHFRVPR